MDVQKKHQECRIFWGPDDPLKEECPTIEERRWAVDRNNPQSPFARFIGNDKAIKKLQASACAALGRPDHLCRDLAFALFGPASCGKTTLARLYAQTVQLPFIEISPKMVKSMDDLFAVIEQVLKAEGVELVELKGRDYYILPPCVIFLDEVHAVVDSVIQGLLKPTEYNDGMMMTESGKTVNCHYVCWMVATTDEGKLFDAFRTRFSPINLKYLTKPEIAKIVKLANPDLPDEVCAKVAYLNSRIPRKALEFARYMKLLREMSPQSDWLDLAAEVAVDEGIDQFGMHEKHLLILKALGQSPIARNRITTVAESKAEEVERFIMPWLLVATEDSPALVTVTHRGYTITKAGVAELEKRGIGHNAKFASTEYSP